MLQMSTEEFLLSIEDEIDTFSEKSLRVIAKASVRLVDTISVYRDDLPNDVRMALLRYLFAVNAIPDDN